MKIRHKQSGVVLEGPFVAMGEGNAFGSRTYYVPAKMGMKSQYLLDEWEEVKPVWRDVTAECVLLDQRLYHERAPGDLVRAVIANGYRKRFVRYLSNAFVAGDDCNHMHAFIIEQRQA